MKILALADRRTYPPFTDILRDFHTSIDLIVTLGDLDFHDLQALSGYPSIPKMGVYGNHCGGSYLKLLGIENLHYCVGSFGGLDFIGMEGCPRYKRGPFQYTQAEAIALMDSWPHVDVILSHTPPFGVYDDSDQPEKTSHHGWHGRCQYIERENPGLVLHGHTHPENDSDILGETAIWWVWRHRFMQIN